MDRISLKSRSWLALGVMIALCLVAPVTNPITDSGMLGYTRPVVFALWGAGVILLQLRAPDTKAFTRRSCVLAVTGLALLALPYFQTAIEVIRFPYALEWEGSAYKAAWLLANGRPIYHPWDNPVGGVDAVYSPGIYVVLAVLLKVFPPGIYLFRLIIFTCAIGTTILTWRLVHRTTGSVLCAAAAALFPLTAVTRLDLLNGRADALAWLFSLAGFFIVYESIGSRDCEALDRKVLLAAAALFLLSTLTKQSYMAAPTAVFLFLLIHRRWRFALDFGAVYGISLIAITATLSWMTDGRYFFLTYEWPRLAVRNWATVPTIVGAVLLPLAVLLLPVVVCLWQERRNQRHQLVSIYVLLALSTTLTANHIGASTNYLLESIGLLGIAFGLTLSSLLAGRDAAQTNAALLIAGMICFSVMVRSQARPFNESPLPEQKLAGDAVLRLMSRIGGPMLSYEPYLIMQAGQPENTVDMYVSLVLAPLARAQADAFLDDLAHRKFSAIVIDRSSWSYHLQGNWIWTTLLAEPGRIVGEHYRNLRREEYSPDELPAYSRYLVLVPCTEGCGVSPELPDSQPARAGPYRRLWQWMKSVIGRSAR